MQNTSVRVRIPPVNRFPSDREAKEFVVAKIVEEAQREGVSLSEVERKMLYFSETDWTLPDIMAVSDEFDKEYDRKDYEKKIAGLIRRLVKRIRKDNRDEYDSWMRALRKLSAGDHYVPVMVRQAGPAGRPAQPYGNVAKLLFVGLLLAWYIGGGLLLDRLGIDEGSALAQGRMLSWLALAVAIIVFVVLYVSLGPDRTYRLIAKIAVLLVST